MNPDALLTFQDVVIQRGGQKVLEVEHLDILRGESLVVIGPNGAGKSTLLLTAAGLIAPKTGKAEQGRAGCLCRQSAGLPPPHGTRAAGPASAGQECV